MSPRKIKHILVLRFSAMGDVAMTVPVITALIQQYPEVKVTVVSRGQYKAFFDNQPRINFFEANFTKFHKGITGLWKLFSQLNDLHLYAVADLHNVIRSKVLTTLFSFRGKKTATTDKLRPQRKQLTALKNKVFVQLPAVAAQHAEVFAKLGFPLDMSAPVLLQKEGLTEDITGTTGDKQGKWIGMAPFAQHRTKVYPRPQMQEVINLMAAKPDTTIFLFGGGRDEAKLLKKFAGEAQNIHVIAGGLFTLKQELKLISNLDAMLSMDSANGHMAALYGVPVITLWGATHPYAGFGPYNQPLSNSLMPGRERYPLLPTSVYGNKQVPGYEDAMATISPQAVVDKIAQVI